MRIVLSCLICIFVLSGCSANMAASGRSGPDFNQIRNEYSRTEVERLVGLPLTESKLENGHTVALYDVEAHIDPSISRAAVHAFMDLATAGVWEFVGGPIEVHRKSSRQKVTINYNKDNRVVSITKTKPAP